MNEIEKKVLTLFLVDIGLSQPEIMELISKSNLVNREVSTAGFFATIEIPEQYRNCFAKSQQWSRANGKTNGGVLVGFLIFPPEDDGNNIILEGYTYDEFYPQDENDYQISLDDLS